MKGGDAMVEIRQRLEELRRSAEVNIEHMTAFFKRCHELGVPMVTVYSPEGLEGWYRMTKAYVFTSRTDAREHVWYFSPRAGLIVSDANGKNELPFGEWDPEGDLFTDAQRYFEGHTNVDPWKRERLYKS